MSIIVLYIFKHNNISRKINTMSYLMKAFICRIGKRQEKGQTLLEYALIITLIVIVIIVAMSALGPQIAALYNKITT